MRSVFCVQWNTRVRGVNDWWQKMLQRVCPPGAMASFDATTTASRQKQIVGTAACTHAHAPMQQGKGCGGSVLCHTQMRRGRNKSGRMDSSVGVLEWRGLPNVVPVLVLALA